MAFFEGRGRMQINEVIETLSTQIARGSAVVIVSPASTQTIQLCTEILVRRRLKPIVIQVNRDSFTPDGTDPNEIEFGNISGISISYGDSISGVLESVSLT
jgi:hypothetical protein